MRRKVWKMFSIFSLQNQCIRKRSRSSTSLALFGLYGDELEQMLDFHQSVEIVFGENSLAFNSSSIVCVINFIARSFPTSI